MRAFLLLLLCCCIPMAWGHGLDLGERAPTITATLLDGSHFDSAAEPGKVVLVHFWATWCTPCREEMPALEAFYRAHRDQGLVVVAISLDDAGNLAKVKAAMAGMTYPTALIENTDAKGYGRIWHVPLTFLIDRHGMLRRNGFKTTLTLDAAALDHDVLPLLREN